MAKRTTTKKTTKAKKTAKKRPSAKAKTSARTGKKVAKRSAVKSAKRVTTSAARTSSTTKAAKSKSTAAKVAARSTKKKAASKKSTNSKAAKKKTSSNAKSIPGAASATSQDPIQFPQDRRLPKTHLTAKELREFKNLLLAKRAELAGDVERLSSEALSNDARGQGEQSAMPIHMADVGSDNWEQEFTLGLLANEEALVREIDDALTRIDKKTYGICIATGMKISVARLRAQPWAQYCIEYARAREEGRAI